MEIERKFLINEIPYNLNEYDFYTLEQAYISTNPVIRIRKKINTDEKYILTIKSSGMMTRQEYELEIDKTAYDNLLKKAEGNIITKDRYIIPLDNSLVLELDIFKDAFDGLIMGEIEFPDEETAKKYTPPAYVSEEVTYDKRFHNSTMSSMSLKEISELNIFAHRKKC